MVACGLVEEFPERRASTAQPPFPRRVSVVVGGLAFVLLLLGFVVTALRDPPARAPRRLAGVELAQPRRELLAEGFRVEGGALKASRDVFGDRAECEVELDSLERVRQVRCRIAAVPPGDASQTGAKLRAVLRRLHGDETHQSTDTTGWSRGGAALVVETAPGEVVVSLAVVQD